MNLRAGSAIAIVGALFTLPVAAAANDVGPGVIAAVVRDASGKPLQGALVVADGPVRREATTTVAGIVTLLALPIGAYDVSVTRAGYASVVRRVDVSSDPQASTLQVSVAPTSLAQPQGIASAIEIASLAQSDRVLVDNVIETTREATIVPVRGAASGAAPALLGTDANETRVELDGIPIAGGAASFAAMRFRNAVGLDTIAFERGPVVVASSLQDAIGGIIDYRTPGFDTLLAPSGDIGYSSTFGSFQHAGTVRSFGPVSIVADAVTGGGENRTQTLKARYSLSRATSLDFAAYGSQSATTVSNVAVTSVAPAYAADLHTSVGGAALQLRAFGSAVSTSTDAPLLLAGANEDDRTRGIAGSIDIPLGQNDASFSYDRRSDFWSRIGDESDPTLARTYTSFTGRGEFKLSKSSSVELGDEYAGGTSLQQRHDPHVALALHPTDRLILRAAAGSDYAVAPGDLILASSGSVAPLRPETSFGYRVSLEDQLTARDRIDASVFDLRRFDRFATYASARTFGMDLGFTHKPLGAGFGGGADVTLQRANAYGSLQPFARVADVLDGRSLEQLAGNAYYTSHAKLDYTTRGGFAIGLVDSLAGANNALAPHAIGFVDVSGKIPLANFGDMRIGENNVLGTLVADPLLAPYYVPREFTIEFRFGGGTPNR